MIKWLNYHHLLYFRVIATEGSIARASDKLLVGQPALSAQLKQLEENLGQQLFERKNRSLVLTEAGKVALEYANDIFKKGEEFVQVFNNQSLSLKSDYRIGVSDGLPKSLACDLAKATQKFSDDAFISMIEGTPEELIEKVQMLELDIAISNLAPQSLTDGLILRKLGSESISVYGSKKFMPCRDDFPMSLNNQPFILPTKHSPLRYDIEHSFQKLKIHYDLIAEVQDSGVKKMMAENGLGLVLLPDFAAEQLLRENKIFKIGSLPDVKEKYSLIAAKRTIKSPITDHMMENFILKPR